MSKGPTKRVVIVTDPDGKQTAYGPYEDEFQANNDAAAFEARPGNWVDVLELESPRDVLAGVTY